MIVRHDIYYKLKCSKVQCYYSVGPIQMLAIILTWTPILLILHIPIASDDLIMVLFAATFISGQNWAHLAPKWAKLFSAIISTLAH